MSKPKILIHSNSPATFTGYGVQTALLADRLAGDGYKVAVSATYGHNAGSGLTTWTSPSGHVIPIYPSWFLTSGDDVICAHARQFFGADDGWIIPLIDVWALQSPSLRDFNVAAWAPVDHDPVPGMVLDFFARSKARCIAMSRHGEAQFKAAGLDPAYIPLAVDTKVYRPTFEAEVGGRTVNGRQFLDLPERAFVVGMVAMNKDHLDRKGWAEAFKAFAEFQRLRPNAILHVHSEKSGTAGGLNLPALAKGCGIPDGAIRFTNQYAYMIGFPPELMALMYAAFDVFLAPSAGEGFGVPLIEAQACGVPVITTDFTAQAELVGGGWLIDGQRIWDMASASWYLRPNVGEIVDALEAAYAADLDAMQAESVRFAANYDADVVFLTHWRPYLATLDLSPPADKPPMTDVAILVPAMKRPGNVRRLVESFHRHNDGSGHLYYVLDPDDAAQIEAVERAGHAWIPATRGTSFAAKINEGFARTTESFVFVCGDDVEFTAGWIEAARELSDRYDVIGTNDSETGRIRNPKVAAGTHADHFFVRRTYVDDVGASLEGPGVLAPEAYFHFYTDVEIIQLAKARGVFTPCLASHVIHHHPGYDGREDLREADPVYMRAVEFSEMDQIAFRRRAGLIDHQNITGRDIWP